MSMLLHGHSTNCTTAKGSNTIDTDTILMDIALQCQTCRKDIKVCEYGTLSHTSAIVNQRRLTCRKQENACWIWPPRRTQGAESIHARFNGLQRMYHSVPAKVRQLVLMVKEHLLSMAPQNVAATLLLPAMT